MSIRRASFSWWSWWARFCVLTRAFAEIVSATATLEDSGATSSPPDGCQDRHAECQRWAELGECASNPDFMGPHCPSSCNSCPSDPVCEDESDQCVAWSQRGECERNPSYMLQYCLSACTTLATRSEKFPFMLPVVANIHFTRGQANPHKEDRFRGSSPHSQGLGHEEGRKSVLVSGNWQAGGGGGRQDTAVSSGLHVGCGAAEGLGHGEGRKDRGGEPEGGSLGLSSIVNRRLEGRRHGSNRVSGQRGASGGPSYASSEGLRHEESTDGGRGKSGSDSDGGNEGMSDSGNGVYHHRTKRTINLLGGDNEWSRGLSYSPGYRGSNCNPIRRLMTECGRPGRMVLRQPEVLYPRQQSRRQQRTFPYVLQWLPQLPGKLQKIGQLLSLFQQQPQPVYSQAFASRQPPMHRVQILRQPQAMRCGFFGPSV